MFKIEVESLSPRLAVRLKNDIIKMLMHYEDTSSARDDKRAAQYAVNRVELRRVK